MQNRSMMSLELQYLLKTTCKTQPQGMRGGGGGTGFHGDVTAPAPPAGPQPRPGMPPKVSSPSPSIQTVTPAVRCARNGREGRAPAHETAARVGADHGHHRLTHRLTPSPPDSPPPGVPGSPGGSSAGPVLDQSSLLSQAQGRGLLSSVEELSSGTFRGETELRGQLAVLREGVEGRRRQPRGDPSEGQGSLVSPASFRL